MIDIFLRLLQLPWSWLQKIWDFLQRPRLHVYFDPAQTYMIRLVADHPSRPQGYFCHVMVENKGKRIAKNCRGRLIQVSTPDSQGYFQPHSQFVTPEVLK